ncbi:MAG TPA: FlgD immunoglobulin-like domain containing protein [Candidatus Limnocylindrales bacterium]|nr:FlgD immunoglobulin-like domain containing protein [Candidatus Limnocylindrales bacterium]
MTHRLVAVLLSLLAVLAGFTPVRAATAGPKVVIIVGATHGVTETYRQAADRAYAEAIKHTSNVVKVYSPNATWAKVKSATVGASIVVYFGHGNGWPSPYTYDPNYTTKDGFGLNATAGNGDYNNKYYGEPAVASLDLAPDAVILLSRLCYASGNSEPGDPAPTESTARKRVDNYAAGFLRSGAQAVIADGHGGPEPYIRALFTTHATIEQVWRSAPNYHGHVKSFASTRTPGARAYTDTDTATSGYYRSLVSQPGLTADDVMRAGAPDTSADPAAIVVPGRAEVGPATAAVFSDATLTATDTSATPDSLPAGTRLRTLSRGPETTASGGPAVEVEGLDDPAIHGWVDGGTLVPRDSTAPRTSAVDAGTARLSPNGDGRFDVVGIAARFTEPVAWRLRIRPVGGGDPVAEWTGRADRLAIDWDGRDMVGGVLPDGAYTYDIDGVDGWSNVLATRTATLTIDTTPAELGDISPADEPVRWFSPNGDGSRDTIAWTATALERGAFVVRVTDAAGTRVRAWQQDVAAGPVAVSWNGRNDAGALVPDGPYQIRIDPRDATGTTGSAVTRETRVATALRSVTTSKTLFYPQDLDRYSTSTTLGFVLRRSARVSWTIRDAAGAVVDTLIAGQIRAGGVWSATYAGRRADGTRLPVGTYTSYVSATDSLTTVAQSVPFRMDAFTVRSSDMTPGRGQTITIKVVSAERLKALPRMYVLQPGLATWSKTMTKTSTYGYSVSITLKRGGSAGSLTLRAVGDDLDGQRQRTAIKLPLH